MSKKLHVVDIAESKLSETQKRVYYKSTHPELASLSELVADFPADQRPLVSDLGDEKSSVIENTPLAKGEIDDAFLGEIRHIKHGFGFKGLLCFSWAFMAFIVALYASMIGAVACMAYFKFMGYTQNFSGANMFDTISNGLFAVFGCLLLLGMIKAVLIRSEKKATHEITKEEEPIFFYYLQTIAEKLDAPMPNRVYVSCGVEVDCKYRSLFSNRIDMYVGLPLVQGFSTKELAGILAHELCRFRQDGSFITERVRRFYMWLGDVTCHRDKLDQYIFSLNKKMSKNPLKLPLLCAELFFWVPRKVLKFLMWVSAVFCQYSIYKIDYECDFYEVQFAGNKKFKEIAYSMEVMSQTLNNTQNGFDTSRMNQSLHDDLPGYVAATSVRMNDEKQKIIEKFNNSNQGITAVHASFKKRVEKTEGLHCTGFFNLEESSSRLFLHLKSHKRNISIEKYHIYFGKNDVKLSEIKVSEADVRDMGDLAKSWEKIENYFHGTLPFEKIPVVDRKYPLNAKNWIQALRDLKKVHESISLALPDIELIQARYEKGASFKRALICVKNFFIHNELSTITLNVMSRRVNRKNVNGLLANVNLEVCDAEAELDEYYNLCSARLCFAIQLLNRKEFRAKIEDGELYRKNLSHILHFLRIFDHIKSSLTTLKNNFLEASALMESNPDNFELENGLAANRILLQKTLQIVELKLREVPYPFTENKTMTIMDYVGFDVPESEDYKALLYVAEEIYDKSTAVYFKVLSKLVFIAEQVEESAGLESDFTYDNRFSLSRTCG